jgi:hypothetical protein
MYAHNMQGRIVRVIILKNRLDVEVAAGKLEAEVIMKGPLSPFRPRLRLVKPANSSSIHSKAKSFAVTYPVKFQFASTAFIWARIAGSVKGGIGTSPKLEF